MAIASPLLNIGEQAQSMERQIMQRTWGRVRQLRVEAKDDRMIVHGFTASYYVKQLAIQAILDVVDPDLPVFMDIQVGGHDL